MWKVSWFYEKVHSFWLCRYTNIYIQKNSGAGAWQHQYRHNKTQAQ